MFFALTDEQRALQDSVREYLADRFPTSSVREVYDDPDGDGIPASLWQAYGEHGWLAVMVPEESDGLGLGVLDAAVLSRCLGAGVAPGPWLPTVIAGEALRLGGGAVPAAAKWLERIASGEVKLAFAPDPSLPVEYAAVADALVAVHDGTLTLLEPDAYTAAPVAVLDRTTRLARVEVTGSGTRLDSAAIEGVLRCAAVLTAADLAGIAREALSRTVAYDKERVQFGKPVGSVQILKHTLADLHIAVTMAEHAVLYAAYAIDTGRNDAALAVSVAKAKASDAARDVTAAMIQFHGGIGYTWEHDAHFFFKRAKRQEYAYGSASEHRERIAKLVVDA
ncbi:MAG TPA: acyl-CoA dehydrogenase family protein [Frankiaceae bacterium]|nr:acyl-CoA dehydrogenase family protein [Frankiaceae bacterium]